MNYVLTYVKNEPVQGKFGPQNKCTIRVNGSEAWVSGFIKQGITDNWHAGDTVDIEIYDTVSKTNGNTYKNFKIRPQADVLEERMTAVEKRLDELEKGSKDGYAVTNLPF